MTIINHTYGFIFVHIPKNAGTSVSGYLSQLSTYRDQEIGGTPLGQHIAPMYRARFGIGKHSTAAVIAGVVGSDVWRDYRTFSITRDPIDRLVSIYAFLRKWERWRELDGFRRYAPEFDRCTSIDEFVQTGFFRNTDGPDRIFRPQSYWLCDAHGELLVDDLIEVRELAHALPALMRSIHVPEQKLHGSVGEKNISERTGIGTISSGVIGDLTERYQQDYRLLGYVPPT